MNVQPLNDRVLIKPSEAEEVTKGGIVLPDTAKEKQSRGRIIAVGNGKLNDDGVRTPLCVAVGDLVVYSKYAGNEVKIDGTAHQIMRESEVLAVIED